MARKKGGVQGVTNGSSSAKEGHMAEANEEAAVAAEDTGPVSEVSMVAADEAEDTGAPAGHDSVAKEIQARLNPQFTADVAEAAASPSVEPEAAILEAALADEFEVLEELGNEGVKAAESAAGPFSEGFQMLSAEVANYSKTCLENRVTFVRALLGVKSFETALQMQASYTRSAYARFLAHLMKMSELSLKLVGEASTPVEKVMAKADSAKA